MCEQLKFINKIKDSAIDTQIKYKIFASVSIAQAILESGWGTSILAQKYFNLYGIKALRDWNGEVANVDTKEWTKNGIITIKQPFRIYKNWNESIKDHAKFLNKDWYIDAGVFTATNYLEQIQAIFNGGYTTDFNYIDKILKLINNYDLKKYDMGRFYMNIIDTNLKFKSLSWCNNPRQIFLHHAEWSNCTVEDIHRCHKENGWSGIGYHFFVRKDGSIYKGRPEGVLGSHCKGHNQNSLGICAEGDYMKEIMPQAQKNAIIELCKYLCNKYGIADVRGHKEAPYSTDCPGTNYPLEEIKQAIKGKTYNTNIQTNSNYGIVTATVLNVRDKATTNSNVIGQLKNRQQVHIFKKVGDWYEIYYGQHGGFISKNYIKLI